ncbi:hypothetical protein ACQ5SO_20375 [Rhodovulum sp. DZ06]|uniref:hypothetical protein n=1 Tax=Rhodovulum sp. DZ06 TaxID=3425126 RepID=UPI003D333189
MLLLPPPDPSALLDFEGDTEERALLVELWRIEASRSYMCLSKEYAVPGLGLIALVCAGTIIDPAAGSGLCIVIGAFCGIAWLINYKNPFAPSSDRRRERVIEELAKRGIDYATVLKYVNR